MATSKSRAAHPPVDVMLDAFEQAGVRSILRAYAFLTLIDNVGRPLRDAAGDKAGTPTYTRFMQDYLSLSTG